MMWRPPAATTRSCSAAVSAFASVERRVVHLRLDLRGIEALLVERLGREAGRVAAQLDVRAAAGHVGGDGHRARPAGLGDDRRLLLMELGVEDLVLDAAAREHLGEHLALLDAHGAHEHGPPCRLHLGDLVDERRELGVLGLEHEVRLVVADHRPVGGDRHHLEAVDLVELLLLGHGRAGHARELVVQPEVVLEGDRGEGHRLALDAQALLGLDGLVESLRPAAAGHLAARELVDDDDLAVLDDVVAVDLVQRVRPQRLLEVAREPGSAVTS